LVSHSWRILPGDQRRLQTPALGWNGGGEIQVDQEDREAATTTEPFFEAVVDLPSSSPVRLLQLRGGEAKFFLSPRPLAVQWLRRLRQLLKKRYQL
jgi:putative peptide zinc metalloprotease protein